MVLSLLACLLTGCGKQENMELDKAAETPPAAVEMTEPLQKEPYPILSDIPSWDGTYVARAKTCRTYVTIELVETTSGSVWHFRLPDGSPIPEYLFLSEKWAVWTEENVVRILIGQGGDAGEQIAYRCTLNLVDGELSGTVVPAESDLGERYDFNHNGIPETLTVEGNAGENSSFWLLRLTEDGEVIWTDCAATAHAGWNNLFALKTDGQDYLLRYLPSMAQGMGSYSYSVFSLDGAGGEVPLRSNHISFDIWFDRPDFGGFDAPAVADFLEEVHGYLQESELLFATQNSMPVSGGSGGNFWEDDFTGGLLTEQEDALVALKEYEAVCREEVPQNR